MRENEDLIRLKNEFSDVKECRNCSYWNLKNELNFVGICSSSKSVKTESKFIDLFFFVESNGLKLFEINCRKYFPLAEVMDWSGDSTSVDLFYSIYLRSFERRVESSINFLRTKFRFPIWSIEENSVKMKNRLTKHENFFYLIVERNVNLTKMPFGLMEPIRFPKRREIRRLKEPSVFDQWNKMFQPFYRPPTETNPFESPSNDDEFYSIVILTHKKRFFQLNRLVRNLNGLVFLDRLVVIFNQLEPIENSTNDERISVETFLQEFAPFLPSIHVEIVFIFNVKNSLNNRFRPWNEFLRTDGVLSLDDESILRHDEIEYAFRVWKENRDRIVGFIPRSHHSKTFQYESSASSCFYSIVLTGAAFIHRWFFDFYTNFMPKEIFEFVENNFNCEDLAMNFLVSRLTKKTPIRVGNRTNFLCFKCQESLSGKVDHYLKRTECLKYFSNVYRSMPLRYSIFHPNSLTNFSNCLENF